ncbi:MAG: phospholipid carrier-dependent glycosyltransferase [Chloroflexi bacterium]|nr:phospholipid carrier-dependent glycosyltransferase [Chloroflexota bacterium]
MAWGGRYGVRNAAALTFTLLLFDPNILAHGRYTTTDLGGTLFLLLAVWGLWKLWGNSWELKGTRGNLDSAPRTAHFAYHLLRATFTLGCAFASKLSTLGFVPIFFVLAVLPLYGEGGSWSGAARRVGQLIVAGALSLLVIWAIFAFEWGHYRFRSADLPWLVALNEQSGPLPTFAAGLEQMILLGQDSGRPTFLLGETSVTGFPLYFPIAFLVKTPLITLVGWLVAAIWLIRGQKPRPRPLPASPRSPLLHPHDPKLTQPWLPPSVAHVALHLFAHWGTGGRFTIDD